MTTQVSHSAILGGSNAERLLNCPASYQEQLRSPIADIESVYAAEGTLLHNYIAEWLRGAAVPATQLETEEQAETIAKALEHLETLKAIYGGGFRIVAIEKQLPLPGVIGAFGSVDLILASKTVVIVLDFKFGSGVLVPVLCQDTATTDYLRPQLAFYACAARAKFWPRFAGKRIVCAIIQPRVPDGLSHAETDAAELDAFLAAFKSAYLKALGRNPPHARGDWCRFAICRATCPLWTGPAIDLALLDPTKAALRASQTPAAVKEYATYLSKALTFATLAEHWIDEIRRQGHLYLEEAGSIPGWKLVQKRATRKWLDEEKVPAALLKLGANGEDIFTEPAVKSVAQMEVALKPKGIKVPEKLYHAVSSGTTIAPLDDKRPAADRDRVTTELRKALKAL